MLKQKATHLFLIESPAGSHQYATAEPVLRVGASADCAIRIPGLPQHALTLVLGPAVVRVLNRSATSLRLGSNNIGTGEEGRLRNGARLQVGKMSLTWSTPNQHATSPKRKAHAAQGELAAKKTAVEKPAGTDSGKGKNDIVYYAILALCAAIFGYWQLNGLENSYEKSQPEFEHLVSQLRSRDGRTEHFLQELLQQARANEKRDINRAAIDYWHIGDISKRLEPNPQSSGVDLPTMINMFATERRQALAR